MTVTLITGANKGLGYETARQLIGQGHTVYLGARDVGRGAAAASELGGRFVQLDVTDDGSVDAALATIAEREGHLDVLVNNAGVSTSVDVSAPEAERVFDTNVIGIVRVTQAALPLLEQSAAPVVVNVSSALGSFWAVTNPERRQFHFPAVVYGAFKDPQAVSVNPKDILRIIRGKSGHNAIFDVEIAGIERTPVIVADEQYDPVKDTLIHIDLKRIDLTRKLRVSIPVHTVGEPKGVKQQGGVLDVVTRSVEIECIPDDIPNQFDVDVTELMIGSNIRVSELPVSPGVRILTAPEAVIAHVVGIKEEVVAAPAEGAAPAAAEPEVAVKKGKKEEEAAAPAGDKGKAAPDKGKKK